MFPNHQQRASHHDPHRWRVGLNVLSVETFNNLQVPYDQLQPTKPFSGVTDDSTVPIGQVRLPVTFGARDNYRTELIDFDVAYIRLPYNAILGYPVLAKFMAGTRLQRPQDARKWRSHHGALRRERRSLLPGESLSGRIAGRPGSWKQEASRGRPQEEEDIDRTGPSVGRSLWARACSGGTSCYRIGKRAQRPPQAGLGGSPLEGHRPS